MRDKRKPATKSKCSSSCYSEAAPKAKPKQSGANKSKTNNSVSETRPSGSSEQILEEAVINNPPSADISPAEVDSDIPTEITTSERGRKRKSKTGQKRKRSPPPSRSSESELSSTEESLLDSLSDSDDALDSILNKQAKKFKVAGNKGQSFSPLDSPIATQVPHKLQKKIWKHKYVDLGALLPITFGHDQDSSPFQLQVSNANGNLNLVPAVKKQKIYNIDQWTTAFMRFVAIYAIKYPYETPALMKYGELVRDLASKHTNNAWSLYDFQFRTLREQVQIPWEQMHTEFWVRATTPSTSLQPFRHNRRPGGWNKYGSRSNYRSYKSTPNNEFLPNTCWPFNRRGFCSVVKCFPHVCGYCRGQHSAKSCPVGHKQDSNSNQQTPQFHPNPNRSKPVTKSK